MVQRDECLLRLTTGPDKTRRTLTDQEGMEFPDETKKAITTSVHLEELYHYFVFSMTNICLALLLECKNLYDGHLRRIRFPDNELPIKPNTNQGMRRSTLSRAARKANPTIQIGGFSVMTSCSKFMMPRVITRTFCLQAWWITASFKYLLSAKQILSKESILRTTHWRDPYALVWRTVSVDLWPNPWLLWPMKSSINRRLTAFCLFFGKYQY